VLVAVWAVVMALAGCAGQADDSPALQPSGEILVSDDALRHVAIDLETGRVRQMAPSESPSAVARWSADHRHVAFAQSNSRDGTIQIRVARDSGAEIGESDVVATFVGQSDEAVPTWSPGCERIAFGAFLPDGKIEVVTANTDGSDRRSVPTLALDMTGFDWAPSAGMLVAHRLNDGIDGATASIVTIDISTGEVTELVKSEDTADAWPRWSPDGRTIVFSRTGADGSSQIVFVDADGSNQRTLETGEVTASAPVWSPDGEWIAYSLGEDRDVAVSRIDGSRQQILEINGGPTDWGDGDGRCTGSGAALEPLP